MTATRGLAFLLLAGLLSAAGPSSVASAKEVDIEWERVELASKYQIQIMRDGSKVIQQELAGERWGGDLKPGNYEYRIRTMDRLGRWGEWSAPLELIVLPDAPVTHPATPAGFHGKVGSAELSWDKVPGVDGYRVRLFGMEGGNPIETRAVDDTHAKLLNLGPGHYRWQVSGIVKVGPSRGASPASESPPDELETRPSAPRELVMQRLALGRPDPRSPVGPSVPRQGRVRFSWTPVDGAESYQIRLRRASGRDQVFTSRSPSLSVRLSTPGAYSWKVRALASDIPGPEADASFTLSREPLTRFGEGYVALSSMIAPYGYAVNSPSRGYDVSTHAMSSSLRLSGAYFFLGRWSVGGSVESTFVNFSGINVTSNSADLSLRRTIPLGEGDHAWVLLPRLGVEERQYIQVYPDLFSGTGTFIGAAGAQSLYAAGPQVGLELRKEVSRRLSVAGKVSYFLPVLIGGGPAAGASISGLDAYRNVSMGMQGLYWLDPRWAAGVGGLLDLRSISYEVPGQSGPDQIREDSTCVFASLIYTFGK